MNIGDLVCFNSAGQRKTSLGVVLALKRSVSRFAKDHGVLIMWAIAPKITPRVHNLWQFPNGECKVVNHAATAVWYVRGSWFEVINEDR